MVLDFRVLGPVRVTEDGEPLAVPAGKQRSILAALVIRANRLVPSETMIEALWAGAGRGSGRGTLHTHIMRLRRALGATAGSRVHTRGDGYLLEADESEVDHLRFTALRDRAAKALAREAWAEACDDLQSARDQWTGRPLEDLAAEGWLADEATRLEELRWLTLESWVEAEQRLGRHGNVIPDLRALTQMHPLRERFHGQLMLSLHATGRTAEALDVYQKARSALVDGLGIEPGVALRAAHQAVLAGAPVPARDDEGAPGRSTPPVPQALPAGIGDFTGRDEQVGRLLGLMLDPGAFPGGDAVVISSIAGMGGIGKTALAVHVGHLAQAGFPDGQLFTNLRGTTRRPLDPHDVLGGFLRQLGLAAEALPADPDERADLYRSLLADRRMLVLLDDARDAAQVKPLIPGGPGNVVLVTARGHLTGLDGAVGVHLDTLPEHSALELFARIVGTDRVLAEPEAVREVLAVCGGLPLAIRIAGARLAKRSTWRVADLAERLRSAERRLDGFDRGDRGLRASFEAGYEALAAADGDEADQGSDQGSDSDSGSGSDSDSGPGRGSDSDADPGAEPAPSPAARAFCLLGLWAGADLGLPAAGALLGLPPQDADPLLEQLVDANLAQSPRAGRYSMHDLLHDYAAERAEREMTAADREAALVRLLTWYTLAADAADRLIAPARTRQPLEPAPGLPPVPRADTAAEAVAWCGSEQANLVSAVHQARAAGLWQPAYQLPTAMWTFLKLNHDMKTWVSVLETALEAARRGGDRAAEATARNNLAIALVEDRRPEEAMTHLEICAEIRRGLGEHDRASRVLTNLGIAAMEAGMPERAIGYLRGALEVYEQADNRHGSATAHSNLGELYLRLDRPRETIAECVEAERLFNENPKPVPEVAEMLSTRSEARLRIGDLVAARRDIEGAARIQTEFCDRHGLAHSLRHLGHVLLADADADGARRAWREAADILGELGDPAEAEVVELIAGLE